MILRAELAIEVEASDYVSAADHQRRLEGFVEALKAEYERVDFTLRERRPPTGRGARPKPKLTFRTGNLNNYEES
jgi:hypothetical protein